jgi:predicted AAA+ superfamily ATPase
VWQAEPEAFVAVKHVNRVPLQLLKGLEHRADQLLENTERFAKGLPANNALLWGARGMGKSSLVKAAHHAVRAKLGLGKKRGQPDLKLVEIHREDIGSLPRCLTFMRESRHRFIVFCDDLSFDRDDTSYKSLKAVLEGGIEGRPQNVIFYATSNRRHLMPRDMMENERSTAINPSEAVEEKVSLSDRFGLWLGFHHGSQDQYIEMIRAYAAHYGIKTSDDELVRGALEWSMTRGARSGRVAWQYIQDLAGRLGHSLKND